MSVNLKGKAIPIRVFSDINVKVLPDSAHRILNGQKRPSKRFDFEFALDIQGHLFAYPLKQNSDRLPLVDDDGMFIPEYSVEDIVEAASGNVEKQMLIDQVDTRIRGDFLNVNVLTQNWLDGRLLPYTVNILVDNYNEILQEKSKENGTQLKTVSAADFNKITTYRSLSKAEAEALAKIAVDKLR